MKRLMFACFVAFWSSALTLWGYAALAAGVAGAPANDAAGERSVSTAELAGHDSAEDCWMAIGGVVYDFTAYIPQHPTPPVVMTGWCGKDATEPYRTKGYGRPHSPAADALLSQYRVGVLESP